MYIQRPTLPDLNPTMVFFNRKMIVVGSPSSTSYPLTEKVGF